MMMALGTFVFSLPTLAYQQLQRSTSWRHASTERVGARAAHQFVGPGEETVELSGLIAPELTGTPASLDILRDLADEGRPLALVDGMGRVHGAFVITSLNETHTLFFQDGTPRRIEFQLSLRRVDDESPATDGQGA
ncbi:MAG TPA: phage tail protein [Lysobacter sp.]